LVSSGEIIGLTIFFRRQLQPARAPQGVEWDCGLAARPVIFTAKQSHQEQNFIMALREKLEEDIKTSMRGRDQARLDALRFYKNAVLAVEKEQKKELDDAGMIEVATKQASDRRDSIKAFEEGGRDAMAAKESAELVVLEEFLPPQMSPEEIGKLIRDTASEVGAASIQDKGKLMGKLMPQVRGKADGTVVNEMATEYLESLA